MPPTWLLPKNVWDDNQTTISYSLAEEARLVHSIAGMGAISWTETETEKEQLEQTHDAGHYLWH